jgi:predicted dehydrogenase
MQLLKVRSVSRRAWMAGAASSALAAQAAPELVRLPRKIRVAVLGLDGHPTEIFDPLPRLPDVEVVALAAADEQAMVRTARNPRLSAARRYTDYRRMLDREKLDLVAVCNSNGERAAAILACVERKLHVIAEKPLAIEHADLERIKKNVAQTGVRLSMLLPMRFSPPYLALKKVAASGEIGEVVQIAAQKSYKAGDRAPWFKKRSTYGGTIPWIGSHMVDLMRWASGREFTEVFSYQNRIGFPEMGDMENVTASVFRLDNGGAGVLRMDYFRPATAPTHGDDRLRLAGLKGVAEYQAATGVTVMSEKEKPRVITELPPAGSVFVDFLESVYNGKAPALSLEDIYRVCEIVLAARDSAEQHRVVRLV